MDQRRAIKVLLRPDSATRFGRCDLAYLRTLIMNGTVSSAETTLGQWGRRAYSALLLLVGAAWWPEASCSSDTGARVTISWQALQSY